MKVTIDGAPYVLWFQHGVINERYLKDEYAKRMTPLDPDPALLDNPDRRLDGREWTEACLARWVGRRRNCACTAVIARARVVRHVGERPNREKARRYALAKLLQVVCPGPRGHRGHHARIDVWNAYFATKPKGAVRRSAKRVA